MIINKGGLHDDSDYALPIDNEILPKVQVTTFLGIKIDTIDSQLQCNDQLRLLKSRLSRGIYMLKRAKLFIPKTILKSLLYDEGVAVETSPVLMQSLVIFTHLIVDNQSFPIASY